MTVAGVFVGNDPAALASYNSWLGSPSPNVLNYLNNGNWPGFDSSIAYQVDMWRDVSAGNIWSVPLTVWGTSLEEVATGAFNSHFHKAAVALAQTRPSEDGMIYVRVGWEFNGAWMPWAAKGHEAAFVEAFQELVTTFRAVSNQFRFVWDTTNDGGNMDPTTAYPGDAFVDVVGTDVYYDPLYDGTDAVAAFRGEVERPFGLRWQQEFAAAHGKATAISEWGVKSDNAGPYIAAITEWMLDHRVTYANYWNSNADYPGTLSTGHLPSAGEAYKLAIAGLLSDPAPLPDPSPPGDKLLIEVSGDSFLGDPRFVVAVDGEQIGGVFQVAASHARGETEVFEVSGSFGAGPRDVTITFLEDAWGGTASADRNLYLHGVTLNGVRFDADAATNGAGGSSVGGVASLLVAGSATIRTEAASPDTLAVRVSGDAYLGNPAFTVHVDGRQVGGVMTTSASHERGETDLVELRGTFGSGPHTVVVTFVEDAWGGTAATDRNLYLHEVIFNGASHHAGNAANSVGPVAGGVAKLLVAGSAEVRIGEPMADTLAVRVSGDSYLGDPQFKVHVDGRQVGGIMTTDASQARGETDVFELAGAFGPGPHNVSVSFVEDAWGGTPETDRNLYIHEVRLGDARAAGADTRSEDAVDLGDAAFLSRAHSADWLL